MKIYVGIDFGTSTTVVKYKSEGANSKSINSIKDADGKSDIIPSLIFRPSAPGANAVYGKAADDQKNNGVEGQLISNFKIGLLSSDPTRLEEVKALIVEFLTYIYSCFEKQMGVRSDTTYEIYVSYPAKWPQSLASFMKEAVRLAGFSGNIYGVFEPVAAVMSALEVHGEHLMATKLLTSGKPLNIFMLDMGAGTSDIHIFPLTLECRDGKMIPMPKSGTSYPSISDPSLYGGREIDLLLKKHVHSHLKKFIPFGEPGFSFGEEDLNQMFSLQNAKRWKEEQVSDMLKTGQSTSLPLKVLENLRFMAMFLGSEKIANIKNFKINQSTFEELTKDHWNGLYKMIQSAMALHEKNYGVKAEDIDLVLLTGGHSYWYTVQNLFNGKGLNTDTGRDHFVNSEKIEATHFSKIENEPWRVLTDALPHESVARGLVLYPEGYKAQATAANNVWIRMKVNEKASDPIHVIKVGDVLPLTTKPSELAISFKNQRFGYQYDVHIEVLTGETIDNAHIWTYSHHHNGTTAALGAHIITLGLTFLTGLDYDFVLKYSFTCNEDGSIHFDSKLKNDIEQPIDITF